MAAPANVPPLNTMRLLFADLALLQSQLTTRHIIVSAETHQVTTYASSRLQIDQDQLRLQGEIGQLNSVLAEEQVYRKRKLEYDAIAEKANLFPSRAELGEAIGTLEEEIAGIEAELEREERAMEARREAFDVVVRELQVLRLMGKEPEEEPVEEQGGERARSASPADDDDTRRDAKRPATEVIDEHGGRSTPTAQLNANARPFRPRLVSGLGDTDAEMHVDTGDGGIEVGGVAETPVASKPAVKITLLAEEREEGEAGPTSALSEL